MTQVYNAPHWYHPFRHYSRHTISHLDITSSQKEGNRKSRCRRLSWFSSDSPLFKYGSMGRTDAVSEWIIKQASSWRTKIISSSLAAGNGRSPAGTVGVVQESIILKTKWTKEEHYKHLINCIWSYRSYIPKSFSSVRNLFKMYSHLVMSIMIEILLTSDLVKFQLSVSLL